jgi:hypothetical protein
MLRLRHPLSLLLICVLILLGALRSFSPPTAVGADAPDVVFSAIRAEAILRDLLQDGLPHVAGSPYNRVVRNRVIAQLESFGYQPEIQARFHCNPKFGSCSPVENIIVVKPGTEGKSAVLLTAHYDSSWAGPGAADDGAGVAAVLEIARMAADFPPFRNDVIFLISDSEENGLIGAHAFAEFHPLFEQVGAVINLEARGVTGSSAMFETGSGNRSLIRLFAKSVERPVANSLTYEMYRRMPNDTDYSVYKSRGVTGLNFAFVKGVAVYHSAIDDVDHLDLGSLQHHGQNAWAMLAALGERDLNRIASREDAGYIDLFGSLLIHYPEGLIGGLSLFLGVWAMLAIFLAFRKEFRFRQLRWGLLAIPALLLAIVAGAWLLSWPLGRWPDIYPLEHPQPWAGRLALFGMLGLAVYVALKLFSGRVSACAWMILGWGLMFVLAMLLTNRLPTATHIAVLPLAMFALGSLVDLFRKKSPAPLLVASVAGFAATAFIAFYHFLMLDVVLNFDHSHLMVVPLLLLPLTAMPMLLAFVRNRDLTWRPAGWLLAAIAVLLCVHLLLPGYTADRPRDMTLMYREVAGSDTGYVVLESIYGDFDREYAAGHGFEPTVLTTRDGKTEERPARSVRALNLEGIALEVLGGRQEADGWRRGLRVRPPDRSPLLWLTFGEEAGLSKAWVNGILAFDGSIDSKHHDRPPSLFLVHPGGGDLRIELLTSERKPLPLYATTWHDLPSVLTSPFMGNWPDDAQPFLFGPRAEKIQSFELGTREAPDPVPAVP